MPGFFMLRSEGKRQKLGAVIGSKIWAVFLFTPGKATTFFDQLQSFEGQSSLEQDTYNQYTQNPSLKGKLSFWTLPNYSLKTLDKFLHTVNFNNKSKTCLVRYCFVPFFVFTTKWNLSVSYLKSLFTKHFGLFFYLLHL